MWERAGKISGGTARGDAEQAGGVMERVEGLMERVRERRPPPPPDSEYVCGGFGNTGIVHVGLRISFSLGSPIGTNTMFK